jgi:hypothetical protein
MQVTIFCLKIIIVIPAIAADAGFVPELMVDQTMVRFDLL